MLVVASLGTRTAPACCAAANSCNGLGLLLRLHLLDNRQQVMVGSESPQLISLPGELFEVGVIQVGQHHAQVSWQAAQKKTLEKSAGFISNIWCMSSDSLLAPSIGRSRSFSTLIWCQLVSCV